LQDIKGGVTAAKGFQAAGVPCGIKQSGKKDLALLWSERPCSVAALFTSNRVAAAPIVVSRNHTSSGKARAIVANSGNANACTGKQGLSDAITMAQITGKELAVDPHEIVVASTGIIGVPLPMQKVGSGIGAAVAALSVNGSRDAAEAIRTTDTTQKEIAVEMTIGGRLASLGGIAKGAGMIAPNMATMLAFLTTDAEIEPSILKQCLAEAVESSFNAITVDGDMSTNDMVVLLSNGASGVRLSGTSDTEAFQEALNYLCRELAKMIVKDGEGATKFIEIQVNKAGSESAAKKIALTVANSNLVKTAFFGEDANWGRIMAAIGNAGVVIDNDRIDILFGEEKIVESGQGIVFCIDTVNEILKAPEMTLQINLNAGDARAKIWTTDLSYEYVKINAHYRT
jgi:glutamate N-acetyltransferase/amino-acid N-acetyltransferase